MKLALCFFLLSVMVLLGSTVQAGGNIPDYRVNGWKSPVDYRSYENCYQFGQYDGHVGVDLCRPAATSVKAIADGCVYEHSNSLSYYGGTSKENKGGAVLLRHQTSSGRVFYAVYGHNTPSASYLNDRMCSGGNEIVRKGDAIATIHPYIGSSDHLHFGIRPDAVDFDYIFRGNGCNQSDNCGWVDPFVFLMGEEPGTNEPDPATIPGNQFTVRKVGNYAWYPFDTSCIKAQAWYGLDSNRQIVRTYAWPVCSDIFQVHYPDDVSYDALFGAGNMCIK